MRELKFDTGVETYSLNGVCEIRLNPTDKNVVRRLVSLIDELDAKRQQYTDRLAGAQDRDVLDITDRFETEMRELVDAALGAPVCAAVFGEMSLLAMADGLPIWMNLLFSILDEVDASWVREAKKTNPRIAKYTSKYHK